MDKEQLRDRRLDQLLDDGVELYEPTWRPPMVNRLKLLRGVLVGLLLVAMLWVLVWLVVTGIVQR